MTVQTPRTPRTYRRPVSTWWWTKKRNYLIFVLRELSSLFIGWFVLYLLLLFGAVARGAAAYQSFLEWAAHPLLVVINVLAAAFVVLHVVTFFQMTPKAMVIRLGGRTMPAPAMIVGEYIGLAVVSAIVIWLVL